MSSWANKLKPTTSTPIQCNFLRYLLGESSNIRSNKNSCPSTMSTLSPSQKHTFRPTCSTFTRIRRSCPSITYFSASGWRMWEGGHWGGTWMRPITRFMWRNANPRKCRMQEISSARSRTCLNKSQPAMMSTWWIASSPIKIGNKMTLRISRGDNMCDSHGN